MREAWQDIRNTLGLGPLIVVSGYALVAFVAFFFVRGETSRAIESAVYGLLIFFVWLFLIAFHVCSPRSDHKENASASDHQPGDRETGDSGVDLRLDGIRAEASIPLDIASPATEPANRTGEIGLRHGPHRELVVVLALLAIQVVLTTWVWLGPISLRFSSWAVALTASYALPLIFLRAGGYTAGHVGLALRGSWKVYLFLIALQMALAMGFTRFLPASLWRSDLLAGAMALVLVLGLVGILASPHFGRWRSMRPYRRGMVCRAPSVGTLATAGFRADLANLKPFGALLGLLMISQVALSILLIGDPNALTRPLFPLNGYFGQGPVWEEIFYRGLLQTRLQAVIAATALSKSPAGWAILLTGVVFTAMHIPSHLAGGADMVVELLDFTGGLANAFAAGYLYCRTRNLLPAIVFHSLSFL